MKTSMKRKVAATLAALSLMAVGSAAMASGAKAEDTAPACVQIVEQNDVTRTGSDKTMDEMVFDTAKAEQAAKKAAEALAKKDTKAAAEAAAEAAKSAGNVALDAAKYAGQKVAEGAEIAWNWFKNLF